MAKVAERAVVAIGANLPRVDGTAPLATCRWAVERLAGVPGVRLMAVSSWWRAAPLPPLPGSPDYVNGVVLLEVGWGPEEMLALLQAIETEAGRTRPYPHAPRVLDLDLIDLGGRVRRGPDPVLPHPRAHHRAFVLRPLAEILPQWRHPVLGVGLEALLLPLAGQGVERLGY